MLVAAVAENGVIGADGGIPWHLPEDFAHFKRTTLGHVLVMGRATYESIGRPLPGRTTIVLTRDPGWRADGVRVAGDLARALSLAAELPGDVMVVGGAQVYAAALPVADEQVISHVAGSPAGDTTYPEIDPAVWVPVARQPYDGFEVVRYRRRAPDEEPDGDPGWAQRASW